MSSITHFAAVAVLATALVACGGDSTSPSKPGPPARIEAVSSTTVSGTVGTALPSPLVVHVTDAKGLSVPGVAVTFSTSTPITFTPATVTTDAGGQAQTTATLGIAAGGPYDVYASNASVVTPAHFAITATAGAMVSITATPHAMSIPNELDTARLAAVARDQYGNDLAAPNIAWASRNESALHADANGLVHVVVRSTTPVWIVASAGAFTDSVAVAAHPSPCASTAATPIAVAQVVTGVAASGLCLRGGATGGDYALIPFFGSSTPSATVALDASAPGVGTPPLAAIAPIAAAPTFRSFALRTSSAAPRIDRVGEARLLARELAALRPLMSRGRVAPSFSRGISPGTAPSRALAFGDVVTMNVSIDGPCSDTTATARMRVAAVGSRSIVLADTANPTGGFTDAEYQSFATAFDTLVDPLDRQAFGDPTDIDGNGRVMLVFTRAVNAATPASSNGVFLGFFRPRDLFATSSCASSNVGEMFYLVVPDPYGQVPNSKILSKQFVADHTVATLAHEYQHMINAGRRMYVNQAPVWEEAWLNEGLSHVAEELLFYRMSGFSPRMNLGTTALTQQAQAIAFNQNQLDNFYDYEIFLGATATASPYGDARDFRTLGASWDFLRYLADRSGPTDGTLWYRLVNSTTSGLDNIATALGTTQDGLTQVLRDWTVSIFADDVVPGIGASYTQPSWNYRQIGQTWFNSGQPFPLNTLSLGASAPVSFTLGGGGSIPLRFTVPAYEDAFVTVTSGGQPPPSQVMLSLVRVK